MPYITQDMRKAMFEAGFRPGLLAGECNSAAELALALVSLCESFAEFKSSAAVKARFGMLTPGDLNYAMTSICHAYIGQAGVSYTNMQNVVGAIEWTIHLFGQWSTAKMCDLHTHITVVGAIRCTELELYARRLRPYEDTKIAENGDVP